MRAHSNDTYRGRMQDYVEGQYVLTQEDLHLGLREMPEARYLRWLPLVVCVPIVTFGMGDAYFWSGAATLAVFGGAIAVIQLNKTAARRIFRNVRPEARDIRFRFDAECFRIKTADSSSRHRYRALHRFAEGRTALLLYTQQNLAQIVPKRAFTPEDLERVRAWLEAGVTPRKRKNPYAWGLVLWVVLILSFLVIWLLLKPTPTADRESGQSGSSSFVVPIAPEHTLVVPVRRARWRGRA